MARGILFDNGTNKTLTNMMKTALLAIVLLVGGIAFGQKGKTPEERAGHLTTRMAKMLELSGEQTQQISQINAGIAMKNQGIRDNPTFTKEQRTEIIMSNYEAAKSMYQGVLTTDQYNKFIALEKQRMEKKAAKKDAKEASEEELDDL
jgi:ABC-type molybdenum transport system ATPase subunit/photorepair protein PhrA